jgi:hypothetical protein
MDQTVITPAINDEDQESKLIALAFSQAQKELEQQTASSQVVTHFLRLGSQRAKIELQKLTLENQLLEEKIISERRAQDLSDSVQQVIAALKSYTYTPPGEEDASIL